MTYGKTTASSRPVAVQRCDRFVGRTMNWLYDHLRFVPRHSPLVVCDGLQNRQEFPALTAWQSNQHRRALWRRISGTDVDPIVLLRLRGHLPRILHSHFGYVAAGDHGLWQRLNVPWVIGFYGADVYALGRREVWRERYARIFKDCSRALALGPVMAQHIERLGCPAGKIMVHPLGVDLADLPDEPRNWNPGDPLRVLFAGTFREKKGVPYALQAIAEARRAGVQVELHLVAEASNKPGDRETESAAVELIGKLGLERVVHRYAFVSFQELISLALHCHVFLGPSVTAADGDAEGTPFVLQQMMGTAMPVVATHHADIPFLFGDLVHLLVPERDSAAIAARLIQYAETPRLLREHGCLFREQIAKSFDVCACASRLSDIYESVS